MPNDYFAFLFVSPEPGLLSSYQPPVHGLTRTTPLLLASNAPTIIINAPTLVSPTRRHSFFGLRLPQGLPSQQPCFIIAGTDTFHVYTTVCRIYSRHDLHDNYGRQINRRLNPVYRSFPIHLFRCLQENVHTPPVSLPYLNPYVGIAQAVTVSCEGNDSCPVPWSLS